LLVWDPNSRLGSKGVDEIKNHAFFKEINWTKVFNKYLFIYKLGSTLFHKYNTNSRLIQNITILMSLIILKEMKRISHILRVGPLSVIQRRLKNSDHIILIIIYIMIKYPK